MGLGDEAERLGGCWATALWGRDGPAREFSRSGRVSPTVVDAIYYFKRAEAETYLTALMTGAVD